MEEDLGGENFVENQEEDVGESEAENSDMEDDEGFLAQGPYLSDCRGT